MNELTDKQFTTAAKAMATEYSNTIAQSGMSPEDAANLAAFSLGEVLAQQLGPFAAVERLRDLADVFEKQLLEAGDPH